MPWHALVMTGTEWFVACGAVLFATCWVLVFAASRGRPSRRHAMFVLLAAFLIGLAGLVLLAAGLGDRGAVIYD